MKCKNCEREIILKDPAHMDDVEYCPFCGHHLSEEPEDIFDTDDDGDPGEQKEQEDYAKDDEFSNRENDGGYDDMGRYLEEDDE